MAYASKYYDPIKAHEYYMRTRELKGYEDRYGGHRYDGTSAASSGVRAESSGLPSKQKARRKKQELDAYNLDIKSQIQSIRDQMDSLDMEDLDSNERRIRKEELQDQIQQLRQQTRGGSTAGFNQKGKEAAAYIKSEIEAERDNIIKTTNKEVDKAMLGDVKKLAADIKAMRESGRGFSHKEFKARISSMLGKAKKTKIERKKRIVDYHKQKYQDEIDKLRSDSSMYTYYDNKAKKEAKLANSGRASSRLTRSALDYVNNSNDLDSAYANEETNYNDLAKQYKALSKEEKNSETGRGIKNGMNYSRAMLKLIGKRLGR